MTDQLGLARAMLGPPPIYLAGGGVGDLNSGYSGGRCGAQAGVKMLKRRPRKAWSEGISWREKLSCAGG